MMNDGTEFSEIAEKIAQPRPETSNVTVSAHSPEQGAADWIELRFDVLQVQFGPDSSIANWPRKGRVTILQEETSYHFFIQKGMKYKLKR